MSTPKNGDPNHGLPGQSPASPARGAPQTPHPQNHGGAAPGANAIHQGVAGSIWGQIASPGQYQYAGQYSWVIVGNGIADDDFYKAPLPTEVKAGELVAWRCWKKRSDGRFYSMAMETFQWPEDGPVAGNPKIASEGVHAFKTKQEALKYAAGSMPLGWYGYEVYIGEVELWGEVVEHDLGYRAQYGQMKDKPSRITGYEWDEYILGLLCLLLLCIA